MPYPDDEHFTTLERLKAWMPDQNLSGTGANAALDELIERVSAVILHETALEAFFSASYTETLNGNGKSIIWPSRTPITAVASVTVDDEVIPVAPSVTESGFAFDRSKIYLRGYLFSEGFQNVVLNLTSGFAADSREHRMAEQAALVIASSWWKRRFHLDKTSERMGDGGTDEYSEKDIPPEARRILRRLRRWAV